MSHVFISYSRKDRNVAKKIVQALENNDFDTWIDWHDIPKGEDWEQEIYRGIEEADAFLFLTSPDSVASEMCNKEIAHAVRNGKRILPIVIRDTELKNIHPEISKRNWIFCRDGQDNSDKAIEETRQTIHTDYEWLKYHTQLQHKALAWERTQHENSRLLRGRELRDAEERLSKTGSQKDPQPTDLQRLYILTSQRDEARRRGQTTIGLTIGFVVMLVLCLAAIVASIVAVEQRNEAVSQRSTAQAEANSRATAEAEALVERDRAEEQAKLALSRQLAAQSSNLLSVNNELALLLAIESGKQADTFEADSALREMLRVTGQVSSNTPTVNILAGHTDTVNYVVWDPEGGRVATASSDGTARIWNVSSGKELLSLSAHAGPIWHVAWDPSGKRIATAGNDGTARVWDADNGAELATLGLSGVLGSSAPILSVAWDPSGERIATAGEDGLPRVWDAESGQELVALEGHSGIVSQVSWSPDGKYIATASEDSTARIWNAETGEAIAVLEGRVWGGRTWPIRNATWSTDGSRLLTYGTDESAIIWDTGSWTQMIMLAGPNFFGQPHAHIRHVEWDKAGQRVVIASGSPPENTAEIWDAKTGDGPAVLSGHTGWVEYASWNSDDTKILTASWDGTVRVWDVQTKKQLAILTGHTDELVMAAWSPDGRYIASASKDHTSRIWDLEPRMDLPIIQFDWMQFLVGEIAWNPSSTKIVISTDNEAATLWDVATGEKLAELSDGTPRLNYPEWSPDGRHILLTTGGATALVWDAETGAKLSSLAAFSEEPPVITAPLSLMSKGDDEVYIYMNTLWRFASLSPDAKFIVTADWDGNVKVWDADAYDKIVEFQAIEPAMLRCIAWSPDSTRVAISGADATATIWEASTGQKMAELLGHTAEIGNISWSPDGTRVATASADGTTRVWDALTGEQLLLLTGHAGWVNNVAWSPHGTRLLTSSSDHTARIWDARTGAEISVLTGHTESILHASWSPDGMRIVTASADNTARIWDGHNGALRSVLSDHEAGLHDAAVVQAVWSPNGKYVATAGFDGKVRLHYVYVPDLVEIGCQHAVRNMSSTEWEQYMKEIPYRATCPGLSGGLELTATSAPLPTPTLTITPAPTISSTPELYTTKEAQSRSTQKPVVGSAADARKAFESGTSVLDLYAVEIPSIPPIMQPGDVYVFRIELVESKPLIWAYGWCATSQETLDDNFKHMELAFRLDEVTIPLSRLSIYDNQGQNGLYCRLHYTVIDQWPPGQYQLDVGVTFSESINDGQDTFLKGTHTFRYIVSVSE